MNETIVCNPESMGRSMESISRNEALREYELSIQFISRGCVVRVGCKQIAFEDIDKAMQEIQKYVADPINIGQAWRNTLK